MRYYKTNTSALLGLCSFMLTIWLTAAQDCSSQSVNSCLRCFYKPMQVFNISSIALDDVIPSWNQTVLTSLCQSFFTYSACMHSIINHCDNQLQLTFEGVDAAWQFLCLNSTEEFYNFSSCFAEPDVRSRVNDCNITLTANMKSISRQRVVAIQQYCEYHDEYVKCLSNKIGSSCGDAAADWEETFARNLLAPAMTYLSCPGWGDNSTTDDSSWSAASILIATFTGITLLLMVIVVGVLAIVVLRRRQQQTTRSSSQPDLNAGVNENDPPSYCEPYVVYEPSPTSEGDPAPGEGTQQYRMHYVDPLTGNRLDGGVVSEDALPYKVCPSLPPPYAERPPPSFDESIAATQQVCERDEHITTAAVNEAFLDDEDGRTGRESSSSSSISAADETTVCNTQF